jgi:hypothetical protein
VTVVSPNPVAVTCGYDPVTVSPSLITVSYKDGVTVIAPAPITAPAGVAPGSIPTGVPAAGSATGNGNGWNGVSPGSAPIGVPARSSGTPNGNGSNGVSPATYKGAASRLNIGLTTGVLGALVILVTI